MRVKLYGRLAFAKVNQPESFKGQGKPRYSASLIMDTDGKSHKKVKAAMKDAAGQKWGESKADKMVKALVKGNKVCLIEGDSKPDVDGYEGMMVVNAASPQNAPPTLVKSENGMNIKLDNESQSTIYSGCWVNMLIDVWAQDNDFGKRLNASLAGIQFVKDGEAFAGGRPASEDDFDVIDSGDDEDFL